MDCSAAPLAVDDVVHVAEVINVAGDGDGPWLAEPILRLRLLQELREEGVAEVRHRHHDPPLLLPFLPHPDRHAPLGRQPRGRPLLPLAVPHVRHAELEEAGQRATTAMALDLLVVISVISRFFSSTLHGKTGQPGSKRSCRGEMGDAS
ncbi:unnamed protein product [Musa acuminata var. zebrina]